MSFAKNAPTYYSIKDAKIIENIERFVIDIIPKITYNINNKEIGNMIEELKLFTRSYDQYTVEMTSDSSQKSPITGHSLALERKEFTISDKSIYKFMNGKYDIPIWSGSSDNWAESKLSYNQLEMVVIKSHVVISTTKLLKVKEII